MSVVMVTGANRGIGLGLTKAYLARGDTVVATYREEGRSKGLLSLATRMGDERRGALFPVRLEVRDLRSIEVCYEEVSSKVDALDILINNAGLGDGNTDMVDYDAYNDFGSLRAEAILDMMAVNSVAPILITQRFVPLLEGAPDPKVVLITSVMGSIARRPGPGEYGYCSSKTALNMMGHILSHDLAPRGVTTALLHPGWVRTTLGGPEAPLTVDQSVRGLMGVIDGLTRADSGRFLDYTGAELPW